MFKLSFKTDNAAFEDGASEISRILREVASDIESGSRFEGNVRDVNGNTVGSFKIT